jgi:hypothetical protein
VAVGHHRLLGGPAALTGYGIAGSARPQTATEVVSTDMWGSVARAVVETISFVIYLFCWLVGRRRETSA